MRSASRWALGLALVGLIVGLLVAALAPVTVFHPHGCPSGAPESSCFYPPVVERRFAEYGAMGLLGGGLCGTLLGLRQANRAGSSTSAS